MQDKGRSLAVEVESDVADPGEGESAARRGRADYLSPQDEPAAPRFSPGSTGRGGESGAAGSLRSCRTTVFPALRRE